MSLELHTRADFIRIPLSERRSKESKSLVKIVHADEGDFLSEWSFDDIGGEPYGAITKRPMVYMVSAHEAIEKSMWCYERGMVPLIGEPDSAIAAQSAEKYRIDQLIVDAESLAKLMPYLSARAEPLLSISVIGASFDIASLLPFTHYAKEVRLVLALPETGALAEAKLEKEPVFHVIAGCTAKGESLIVTKEAQLVTPIKEYETGIRVSSRSNAPDGSIATFVLDH